MRDATGEDGWADCFAGVVAAPAVATDGDPIVFDGEDKADFGSKELEPLGSVSREVESERSLSGLTTRVFALSPLEHGVEKMT